MRIGIDARLYAETGIGRYVRNLIAQLTLLDTKNSYSLFLPPGLTKEKLMLHNPRWKTVTTSIKWHTIAEQLQFPRVLEKEELDLVHFPYFSVPVFYKRPYVITIHDLIINTFPTGKASTLPFPIYFLKHRAYQEVIKKASRDAVKILTVSEATKSEIVRLMHVPADKIIVTYEGVDTTLARGQQKPTAYTNYFLYVGNAYPHKNLDRLVCAFQKVAISHPEVSLLLVGRKNYFYERLDEEIKAKGLEKMIRFLGEVNDNELAGLYQNALALVTPSLMEGFGLPGLEAMSQQCLVLASDIPVYKEIYQDACLYFQPTSIEAIHATILKVLDKKEDFASLRSKGLDRFRSFSWKRMAKQTQDVYESSIGV